MSKGNEYLPKFQILAPVALDIGAHHTLIHTNKFPRVTEILVITFFILAKRNDTFQKK